MNESLNPDEEYLTGTDRDIEKVLRPLYFDDFTGQYKIIENLRIFGI